MSIRACLNRVFLQNKCNYSFRLHGLHLLEFVIIWNNMYNNNTVNIQHIPLAHDLSLNNGFIFLLMMKIRLCTDLFAIIECEMGQLITHIYKCIVMAVGHHVIQIRNN